MGTRYASVDVEGLKIFYREAGAKEAPAILLLHGFPSSSHMFRELIPLLADTFRLVAPDYTGFGYSDAPSPTAFEYTFDHLAHVVSRFVDVVGLKRFSLYVQDYGAPIGFRLATRQPERIKSIIVQNGNAYEDGISSAFDQLKPFWANRNHKTEARARGLLARETTVFQYQHGASDGARISPDSYTLDQHFLDRPDNDSIQLELLHNYPANIALYPEWQAYFRRYQPPLLIVSGKNDPFFTPEGQLAYQRDLPDAEVHLLDTGHFALEDHSEVIAQHIKRFHLTRVHE